MRADIRRSAMRMGTLVTIQAPSGAETAIAAALDWFRQVEECCTRFDPQSELMQLTRRIGVPVPVGHILYQVVQFALAVAEQTAGVFDPTVGLPMEKRGFDREYATRQVVRTGIDADGPDGVATYRDVCMDPDERTIKLVRPLVLDLGAVAKGMAIDLAARELMEFEGFAVDAGGDLYLGGCNPEGELWSTGIRHPRQLDTLIDAVRVSNQAVCTSGDYERGGHILNPRTGDPADAVASVTVIAPTAMMADALATAAFVAGPDEGIRMLEGQRLEGLIVTPELERRETQGWRELRRHGSETRFKSV